MDGRDTPVEKPALWPRLTVQMDSTGSEVLQCYFLRILLVKPDYGDSSDSREWEIDSTA